MIALQSSVTGDRFSPEKCAVSEESEAPTVTYKGYEIRATPLQLPESGEWTLDIEIVRYTGDAVNLRPFIARNMFPTQEEAIVRCFAFGKRIIDGKVEGRTVVDLGKKPGVHGPRSTRIPPIGHNRTLLDGIGRCALSPPGCGPGGRSDAGERSVGASGGG